MSNSITFVFQWYMLRYDSKKGYEKNMCSKEIGLHAQNMIIILGLVFNTIVVVGGGIFMTT